MKQYENVLLVTGGAGFIGSAFLRMLVPKYPKWYFINLDALTYAGDLRKVESIQDYENYVFVHGNICDRTLVQDLFDKYKINIVVNFAAESHVDNSIKDAESFVETNIKGTYILLDVAKDKWGCNGTNKSFENYRFLQISTDEVYGSLDPNDTPWTEESILAPNSPYSSSKASAELLARAYYKTYKLPVIITRSSNNYGPFQNNEKFIPTIIRSIIFNQDIPVYGEGLNVRDWIYVDDNIRAIKLILMKGSLGEIYNIGASNEMTNIFLVNSIMKKLSSNGRINKTKDRLGHDLRYSINCNKIMRLGWSTKCDFKDGIQLTYENIRSDKYKSEQK